MTWLAWGLFAFFFLSWIGQTIIISKARRLLVLRLMDDPHKGPFYGLDLVGRSDGVLSRGSVYLVLNKLEQNGLVSHEVNPYDKHKRRIYELTDAGRNAARL